METAVYSLGKLKSKYLIMQVLSFAVPRDLAAWLLWRSKKAFRRLLIENYRMVCFIIKPLIQSLCLVSELDYAFLRECLGHSPFIMTLLYRGSIHGWWPRDFHSRCDNKGPTITLFRTDKDYRIGGYTRVSWQSPRDIMMFRDNHLFTFDLTACKVKRSKRLSVEHDRRYGPSFLYNRWS